MKKTLLLFAGIAASALMQAQTSAEINKYPGYSLSFHDEFDSGTPGQNGVMQPDSSAWEYEKGYVRGTQRQYYTDKPQNVFLKDGMLYIRAIADTTLNPEYNPASDDVRYNKRRISTSGSIYTKDKYRFHGGIIETRAKIPALEGFAPAIWTSGDWHYGYSEIDIMEWITGNDHTTVHWGKDWRNITNRTMRLDKESLPADFFDRFHTWRAEWNQHYIRVYLDDVQIYELPLDKTYVAERGFSPFQNPENKMNYKLNLAFYYDTPVKTFPTDFIIDYTRIYTPDKADSPLVNRISEARRLLDSTKNIKGYTSGARRALQSAIKTASRQVGKTDSERIYRALDRLDTAIDAYRKSGPQSSSDNWHFTHWGV